MNRRKFNNTLGVAIFEAAAVPPAFSDNQNEPLGEYSPDLISYGMLPKKYFCG